QRVAHGILAEFLLLTCGALAIVIELSLLPRQAVVERVTLGLRFLQLSLRRRRAGRRLGSANFSALTGRQLVFYVERGTALVYFGFSIAFVHGNLHWMTVAPHGFISAGLIPLV